MIESHADDYAELYDYMAPEQIKDMAKRSVNGAFDYTLYHTAHCYVSERHEKDELVDLVYALLAKLSHKDSVITALYKVIGSLERFDMLYPEDSAAALNAARAKVEELREMPV